MVGLSQGTPNSNQPVTHPDTGRITQPWLQFFSGLAENASSNTLPDGILLPPGSVDLSAFNKFLTPIGLVNSLPSVSGYSGPNVIFNSADGNLYRLVGGSWTLSVPGSAVVGRVPLGSIPPIPTTQLSGYLQAAQIQANSIGADQISAAYIYAGSITASQITAGTLSAGVILSSSITATQISAGTLGAGVILASSINASQINAGTLTAFTIQTASSGSRLKLAPGVFFEGFNSSNIQTVGLSPNFLADNAAMFLTDSAGVSIFGAGAGGQSIFGRATGASGNTVACELVGLNSSSDALLCQTGGITISNGYLAMGGGNLTGLGSSLTSTASTLFITAGTNVTCVGNILLNSDNTYTVGNPSFRASVMYSAGGVVTTSDGGMKTNIQPETLGLDFINSVSPQKFNLDTDPLGAPLRHGLIAQQVEAALGVESFAGLHLPEIIPETPEGMGVGCSIEGKTPYGLNYSEFIGPIIKAIQELSAQVKVLQPA